MATTVAIAQMRDRALDRLTAASSAISAAVAVDPPLLPEPNRDLAYQQAETLTALADWAETVSAALHTGGTEVVPAAHATSIAELVPTAAAANAHATLVRASAPPMQETLTQRNASHARHSDPKNPKSRR